MSSENKIQFETLSQKAKKKKDFIIVGLILLILSFLFISLSLAFIGNDEKKTFEKKTVDKTNDQSFDVVKKADIKENWALSTENKIEKLKEDLTTFKEDIKEENKNNIDQIKNLIIDSTVQQNKKIEEQNQQTQSSIIEMKNNIEQKLMDQQNQIEDINLRANSDNFDGNSTGEKSADEEIVLGQDLLPELDKKTFIEKTKEDKKKIDEAKLNKPSTPEELKKDELASTTEVPTRKTVKIVELDTSSNVEAMDKEEKLLSELKELKAKQNDNFHLMTGLSQAYMITGAYAPAFDSGEEEPLPVLLQAEGDILIANDDVQTVDKCMLIGTAKGNMNSQTADIRLVKISCSLAEGTKKIEGDISGWVIGENGIPGLQGELLHKNGAWLSRTFLAGFLETFSSSLGKTDQTAITIGTGTNSSSATVPVSTAMSDNAKQAAAGGLSTVFGKIGEYYLKMAEQIFPVIEVKGGRTVNILLKGGEDFKVTDFKKLDLSAINEKIEEYKKQEENLSPTEYIKLKKQQQEESDAEDKSSKSSGSKKPKVQEQNNNGFDFKLDKLEGK